MTSPSYRIAEYDPRWPILFEDERSRIAYVTGIDERRLHHVGSTSVPGLGAKPIIDILVGILDMGEANEYLPSLRSIGYEHRGETIPGTLYIRKAVPRRFNLHMTEVGSDHWDEILMFRDYLRDHPDTVIEYDDLKRKVMSRLASDPPAYNAGKEHFIQSIIEKARKIYGIGGWD